MLEKFLQGIVPRNFQKNILKTCIEKNCLVVLPTGMGKTLIALMLTIERMKKFPGQKTLFLAPTRPLAEQHINSFKKYLPELFADMQLFTGQIDASSRKKIWQTADIIFSTPQCIANDLKKELYSLKEVCLLVEDEVHRCVKNYDYVYVAKRYTAQSKNPRILGLTASPGNERSKIQEICKTLSIGEVEIRSKDSPDVQEYIQELEFEKEIVDFPEEFKQIRESLLKLFNKYVGELRNRKIFFEPASKTNLLSLQKRLIMELAKGSKNYNFMLGASACAQAIKIQHALELLETQTLKGFNDYLKELFNQASKKKSRGVVNLVSKPEFNLAYILSNDILSRGEEHPKLKRLTELIEKQKIGENGKAIIFSQFRETASTICKKLNAVKGVKAKVFIGQTKKNGVGLSQKEQKEIIQDFSEGKINILCATCIGEEGLDIPEVKAVIFYEPIPSAIRTIQRTGRTARLSKGKLIILITKGTRDEIHYYVSRAKEKKMASIIDSIKKDLKKSKKSEKQGELF
ncbi:MAG: DEAD/DEAH box helicase [archaeon]